MKKLIFCIILFCAIGVTLSAQQLPKITIENNTGYPMKELYIQPIGDAWDDWVIEYMKISKDDFLTTGRSLEVILPLPLSMVDTYDIYFIDTDDDMYIKENVRIILGNMRIVFTFADYVGK